MTNKSNTNGNNIKIYKKNLNNEVYSNSNNDDSKCKKLLLNFLILKLQYQVRIN